MPAATTSASGASTGIPGAAPVQALPNNGQNSAANAKAGITNLNGNNAGAAPTSSSPATASSASSPLLVTSNASRATTAANVQSANQTNQNLANANAILAAQKSASAQSSNSTAGTTNNPGTGNYGGSGTTININGNPASATPDTTPPSTVNGTQAPSATPTATPNNTTTPTSTTGIATPLPGLGALPAYGQTPAGQNAYATAVDSGLPPEQAQMYADNMDQLSQQHDQAVATLNSAAATLNNDPAAVAAFNNIATGYETQIAMLQSTQSLAMGRAKQNMAAAGSFGNGSFLSDEQSKASLAIASLMNDMQSAQLKSNQAYAANDLKAFNDAQTAVKDAQDQMMTETNNLLTATQDAIKNAQDEQNQQQTFQLKEMMDDQTISYQDKQQAIAQSTLDEKTKNDLATQASDNFKNQIAAGQYQLAVRKEDFTESQSTPGDTTNGGLPSVSMTADGSGNPEQQQQFLAALPGGANGELATDVQKIASYQMNPASFTTKNYAGVNGITQGQLVALASQYNPSYDESNYAAASKYLASLQTPSGNSVGAQIAAANTGIVHFASLMSAMSAMQNPGGSAGLNSALSSVFSFGNPKLQNSTAQAQEDATAVGEQLAKFFKGSGSADEQTINDWQNSINIHATPAQQDALKTSTIQLLTGQLDTAYSDYQQALGHAPPAPGQPGSLLTPAAITALQSLGVDTSAYMGAQPYQGTSDSDFINSAPGNSAGGNQSSASFFNSLTPTQ